MTALQVYHSFPEALDLLQGARRTAGDCCDKLSTVILFVRDFTDYYRMLIDSTSTGLMGPMTSTRLFQVSVHARCTAQGFESARVEMSMCGQEIEAAVRQITAQLDEGECLAPFP